MDDLFQAVKSRAEALLSDINRPGGVRSTIDSIRRRMAVADQRRAIHRARSELDRLEIQLRETITSVGLQAVALHEAGRLNSPELQPLCQHVVDIKATLNENKQELERLEALAQAQQQASTERCPACGRPLPAEGVYCSHCGAPIQSRLGGRVCANCGAPLKADARFCNKCGTPVPDAAQRTV